jgi:periplasmic protein TonB
MANLKQKMLFCCIIWRYGFMIDYATRQRTPHKHLLGFALVVVFHLALLWAINSGLARKFVKVFKGPVETQLLEDAKPELPPLPPPPPPPPPRDLPPPLPPAYVPPVDVSVVNNAPAPANAIAAVSNVPAPVPAPLPPPAAAIPMRVAPVIHAASQCEKPEYPSASRRMEEEGVVQLLFLIGVDGRVIQSQVEKSSGYNRLDEAARSALSRCVFKPGTLDGKPAQDWASMKYVWRLE